MTWIADAEVRAAVFEWLTEQRAEHGEALRHTIINSFTYLGRPIRLMAPQQGIWRPAGFELPISARTTLNGPYQDSFDSALGQIRYAYRGTDPGHLDNVGLRRAGREHVPIVYFHPVVERGWYTAMYPAFVVRDDPSSLRFYLQVDAMSAAFAAPAAPHTLGEDREVVRREYVTRTVLQRVHQVEFRERVIRAYQERCALCSLRHRELLDAAHIIPDRDPEGEPIVSNGVALCKLHHAAFDRFFFAIRPDYTIEVRQSVLAEHDGPMLVVGLQRIHGTRILLPRRAMDHPDRDRLEKRYAEFLRAG